MSKFELTRRSEASLAQQIAAETQRVIDDHVGTIYALQPWASGSRQYPFTGLTPEKLAEKLAAGPQEVAAQITKFFAKADSLVEKVARGLVLSPGVTDHFKLMLRRLYTVASIESQIAAIETGRAAALQITKGRESGIGYFPVESKSGELFKRNVQLIFTEKMAVFDYDNCHALPRIKTILVIDDVAHSGKQMFEHLNYLHHQFPNVPVVLSLAVITNRAEKEIVTQLRPVDKFIFQEKRPDLRAMINEIGSEKIRWELTRLAEKFFIAQGHHSASGLRATHITTPFKLPDIVSNNILDQVGACGEVTVPFTFREVVGRRDRLYPTAI